MRRKNTSVTTTSQAVFVREPQAQRKSLRILGALLALSSPLSGIVPFAIISALFGEEKLETASGLTGAGYFTMAIPALIGLAMIAWSFKTEVAVSFKTWALAAGALGAMSLVSGVVSLVGSEPGDASIGGGILILTAVALFGGVAIAAFSRTR